MNTLRLDDSINLDSQARQSILETPNSVIYISADFQLSTDVTLGSNSILVFQNGAKLWANTPVTVTGNNNSIEAPMTTVFGTNIQLGGSFVNAEWPAEWWGAKSDGSNAAPAIQRALNQIGDTDKRGTLLLSDRYVVQDTIYLRPGVAISGLSHSYGQKLYTDQRDARGALLADFQDGACKWVIDESFPGNTMVLSNQLVVEPDDLLAVDNTGCNITDLHILDRYPENQAKCFFGCIRLNSMQCVTIHNVDIEAHAFIGLALVGKVWLTSLDNVYIRVCGCGLYAGRLCTTFTASNLGLNRWNYGHVDNYFRLALPTNYSGPLVAPLMPENTLPPYWDMEKMRSCGIIMGYGCHCTFTSACVERFDAVICGTDYNAKFISPYIENINYFFAWLYSSTEYLIPSHRHELIIEDLVSGFETFPSMETGSNGYKYLEWVECEPNSSRDTQASYGYYKFLPTFGTFRGVIKAHNVGRATCWENDYYLDSNNNPVTWNYPSYFIHVTPGIPQRNFYYDRYKVMVSKADNPATQELVVESHLEDMGYCRYKKIIIEGSPNEPVRYYFDDANDAVYNLDEDNKAEMDIYKRALQLGVSKRDVILCSELFDRGLDNFIMTPIYGRTCIDYGDAQDENSKVVRRKRFCIEIINGANAVHFKTPLRLHDCEVTFRNNYTSAFLHNDNLEHLLGISGNCTINFEGNFGSWMNSLGKLVKLCGDKQVKLTIRLINAPSMTQFFTQAGSFITNAGSFVPGFDLNVEIE